MAYAQERDSLRQEMRQSVAGTVRYWPRVEGTGNVVASATASHNTYVVKDPSGAVVQASANATVTSVGSVSQLDLSIPAISTLGEDYRVEITWRQNGASVDYFDVVYFDVVLFPWGAPSVTLNDFLEERVDSEEILTRHGLKLSITAAEMAATYAIRARVELDRMIREQIVRDQTSAGYSSGSVSDVTSSTPPFARPHLILNRERLNNVERKLAVAAMFASDMSVPGVEGGDESGALHAFFRAEAETAWRSVGPLKYDTAGTLTPTHTNAITPKTVRLRRSW